MTSSDIYKVQDVNNCSFVFTTTQSVHVIAIVHATLAMIAGGRIEESQGTKHKGTQVPGGGPSIRDAIDDGESKKMKK
uniref:Uncharacterized protein n=1 Tax=Oryza rufipogon TaxID=4529 RepID=A0A0E0QJM3_ORYRU